MPDGDEATSAQPRLRVVRGEPTPEELAVLTAVVAAAGAGDTADAPAPARGRWSDPGGQFRRQLYPGEGGWRAALR